MSSHSSISSFDDLESPSSESNLLRSPVTFTAPKSGPDYYYDDLIPPPVAPVALKIHREFYIRDSLVDIEVEGYIFRVHRFFLDRESGQKFPKDTPGKPVVLSDTTCLEFESLMRFFYHGMHSTTIISFPEWIAILSIATRYKMTAVRTRAISEVYALRDSIDPVEWILIAEKNEVPEWLLDARTALCQRGAPLTALESERLGHANSAMVAEAREAIHRAEIDSLRKELCYSCQSRTSPAGPKDSEFERLIADEVFGREERAKERERLSKEEERLKAESAEIEKEEEKVRREAKAKEAGRIAEENERKQKEQKLKEIRDAKEKAASEMTRMEQLERALGGYPTSTTALACSPLGQGEGTKTVKEVQIDMDFVPDCEVVPGAEKEEKRDEDDFGGGAKKKKGGKKGKK